MADKTYQIDFEMTDGTTESVTFVSPQGERGTSILKVTTAPSSYTTATGGFTPTYRIALSTVLSQSKAAKVLIGDTLAYSYYHYPVGYVNDSYVYLGTRNSIRGATGSAGAAGADGADGYTPVKGTDYFTEADKAEMVSELVAKLSLGIASDGLIYIFVDGTPVGTGIPQSAGESGDVFGYVDENNTIVLNGNLADGTYTLKYEMDNGEIVNIGNMVLDSNVYYSITKNLTQCSINNSATQIVEGESYSATITANDGYELKSVSVTMGGSAVSVTNGVINIASVTGNIVITAVAEEVTVEIVNQIPLSKDSSGNLFNGGQGWKTGYRLGGDGTEKELSGIEVTGFIPIAYGDTIYMKNITDDGTHIMGVYNSAHTKIGTRTFTNIFGGAVSGQVLSMVVNNKWSTETGSTSGVAYLRVSANEITANSIITVNEPIV